MRVPTLTRSIAGLPSLPQCKPITWMVCCALTGPVSFSVLPAAAESLALEEVVVTARRKDESVQDVPLTVNTVSAEQLSSLNVRKVADLQTVVAGLTLQEDSIAPNASLRGVRFDTFASGFNPTVEFYLNDAPIVSLSAMQAMFDIGQVEVLRGPQGTLRGRASPSGAITLTTRRPDFESVNGYVDVTATDEGGQNVRSALNMPLIEDKLAMRVAGFYEANDGAEVESINSHAATNYDGNGWRVSLLWEPVESVAVNLMHQLITPERDEVAQVESAALATGGTVVGRRIDAADRWGVQDQASVSRQEFERTNLEVVWTLGEQQLNYAGSLTDQSINNRQNQDFGEALTDYHFFYQPLSTETEGESHELRLSSAEPLFNGKLDYVVGMLYQKNQPANVLQNPTLIHSPIDLPAFGFVRGWNYVGTPITTNGASEEKSVFANLTYFITDQTELSAGLRRIRFDNTQRLVVAGATLSDAKNQWQDTIYSATLKHSFNDDLMAYVSYGSSWRPGVNAVGDFSDNRTDLEESFLNLDPETSDAYEIGIKSSWLDKRLNLNVAMFYQEFENYPYRAGGEGVYFIYEEKATQRVDQFNFVAAVPVEVYGVEIETSMQFSERWDASVLLSWSEGTIENGTVPCNRYGGSVPSVSEIATVSGGDHLVSCQASFRANDAPLWTSTLQSEYRFPVAEYEGYVRGLATLYGDSRNDPSNPLDDVDAYTLVNVYAGLRQGEGRWEVMLYGKNIFDTERVVRREASPYSISYRDVAAGFAATEVVSNYRGITLNPAREFGVNLLYRF